MTNFTSDFDRNAAGYSPDRLDALVWAVTDLMLADMKGWGFFEVMRRAGPMVRGLSPGGRWIRTCSTAAREPIAMALRPPAADRDLARAGRLASRLRRMLHIDRATDLLVAICYGPTHARLGEKDGQHAAQPYVFIGLAMTVFA